MGSATASTLRSKVSGVPGPDILFRNRRVAVFVDGCFWHRCPEHATFPKANEQFWAEKLDKNVARDRSTDERLRELGWTVVRVWGARAPCHRRRTPSNERSTPDVLAQRLVTPDRYG